MPCGGRPKSAAVVSSITVAPCVLLPSRKPSLPCGLRSKSFPPVVAAGRAVLPAVSHQQEAARIMYQSVCADMCGQGCLMWQRKWACSKLFPHVINFGARAPKTTRDRFRSTCSEIYQESDFMTQTTSFLQSILKLSIPGCIRTRSISRCLRSPPKRINIKLLTDFGARAPKRPRPTS